MDDDLDAAQLDVPHDPAGEEHEDKKRMMRKKRKLMMVDLIYNRPLDPCKTVH